MEQKPKIMNVCNMVYATESAKTYVRDLIAKADEIKTDARKKERVKACECAACFYRSGIGGAAMTNRPCMSCGKNQLYGSTYTDVLCLDCAEMHRLCKHCGGDLEMRVRRKEWPKSVI